MVLSTRWEQEERESEERERERERRGGRTPEGSMWFGRVDAPPTYPFSYPRHLRYHLHETTFRRCSAHLERRGWRGWFYWSRLTTPSTPSHHAYAPLLPRGEHAGASAGARHRHDFPRVDLIPWLWNSPISSDRSNSMVLETIHRFSWLKLYMVDSRASFTFIGLLLWRGRGWMCKFWRIVGDKSVRKIFASGIHKWTIFVQMTLRFSYM